MCSCEKCHSGSTVCLGSKGTLWDIIIVCSRRGTSKVFQILAHNMEILQSGRVLVLFFRFFFSKHTNFLYANSGLVQVHRGRGKHK